VHPNQTACIDLVEASYDLDVPAAEWLPQLLNAGAPLLDLGMGFYGAVGAGMSEEGVPVLTQVLGSPGHEDLPLKFMSSAQEAGPEMVSATSATLSGRVYLLSDVCQEHPRACELISEHIGCKDILSLTAMDPDGAGVHISMPSKKLLSMDRREREYWQMLEVHISAGHRLRRGLGQEGDAPGTAMTEIPLDADALIDPKHFLVSDARRDARNEEAASKIREAARSVDKARGPLRKQDPKEALRLWQGLVRGKWSLVDWFDTDGRRFLLAKPNAPRIRDPRGLTEREAQVATYAALGDSSKFIGYRLGLSQSYVSRLLRDSMRKLGVKTQAQLVDRMRGVAPESSGGG
jgi:DNA-binding CsgD family transcriptional regulator